MKKTIALLLTLTMLLPLASCRLKSTSRPPSPSDAPTEITTQPPVEDSGPSEEVKYYTIENLKSNKLRYTVYNKNGDVVLSGVTERPVEISMLSEALLDVCFDAGTEIAKHQYYDVENDRLSEAYFRVAATSGALVAYVESTFSENVANRKLVVQDMFDKSVFHKSFALGFSPSIASPVVSAAFTDGELDLEVRYFSESPHISRTARLPVRRAVVEGDVTNASARAMQAYANVINDQHPVYDPAIGSFVFLKDLVSETQIPISDCDPTFCCVDVDGDSINELFINCASTAFLLRYYDEEVFLYSFSNDQISAIQTDGSYLWDRGTPNAPKIGESRIFFEGEELKSVALWHTVTYNQDGASKTSYYINRQLVSKEEFLKYREDNPKTESEFLPLEADWISRISRSEALEIAKQYWASLEIQENGYVVGFGYNSWATRDVYVMVIQWSVTCGPYYSTFDEVWIDKSTGRIELPSKG